ncbi:MAG: RNA polymerase factor sigma-54 [Bdellovibrionota bacterium]
MALEIKLNQKLSQSLVMTPQLQQAIKLLQLGRMEYLEVIERELLENPVLEDLGENESFAPPAETFADANASTGDDNHSSEAPAEFSDRHDSSSADPREPKTDFSESYGDSQFEFSNRNRSNDSDREKPSVEATVSNPAGLASHLLWQLRTSDLPPEDQEIAAQIVGNLDRNGYLCCPLDEIANTCGRESDAVERVLSLVQSLDPAGIAARDLRECLLIQLEQLGQASSLAWNIVSLHLGELEMKRYDVIAKREGVSVDDVYQAIKTIQKLEPRPGRPFVDEAPIYITPDVYVRKVGDDYVVSLNESGMPRLRLNPVYQELLQNGKGRELGDKEYIQDRIRSASWLIRSIQQRQQTIFKVTQSIVKFQREFLEHGVSALKPLVLRDVAADVGMHESTVSRVTTNKYVHTAQGVFELKYFFSSGLRTDGGEVSSESVKERIRELVSKENPKKPLSDQAIVTVLKAEGIDIARRTVAKYREMLNILSSSRRKKMF